VRSSWEAQSILRSWGALKSNGKPAVQLPLDNWEPIGEAAQRVVSKLARKRAA
jgi:hypothetical protein